MDFCAHFGHFITLMASLFTMVLLVMVYFILPPAASNNSSNGTVTISRPSVSNIWFQPNKDGWSPDRFKTWSPEENPRDFNETNVEGEDVFFSAASF